MEQKNKREILMPGDEIIAVCMGSFLKRFVVTKTSPIGAYYKDTAGNESSLVTCSVIKDNGKIDVINHHSTLQHVKGIEYYYIDDVIREELIKKEIIQNIRIDLAEVMHHLLQNPKISKDKKLLNDIKNKVIEIKKQVENYG